METSALDTLMEVFLILNGHEIGALAPEQEQIILSLAAGELSRDDFRDWLRGHIIQVK